MDSTGAFTCFTPRGNSVVDYFIVSECIFNIISHFEVGNPSVYSDHCPLLVNLNLGSSYSPKSASNTNGRNKPRERNEKIIWNQSVVKDCVSKSFRSLKFRKSLESLKEDLCCEKTSLDEIVDKFTQLLKTTIRYDKSRIVKHNRVPRNSWFDSDCKNQKRIVNSMASLLKRNPNDNMAKRFYYSQRKIYKSIIRSKKRAKRWYTGQFD